MVDINAFDPGTLLLIALLNPVAIAVAFLLGRRADQWQKIFVAAFAGALAGFVFYWLVVAAGIVRVHALGGEAAVVVLQFFFGIVWAAIGYRFFRKPA